MYDLYKSTFWVWETGYKSCVTGVAIVTINDD